MKKYFSSFLATALIIALASANASAEEKKRAPKRDAKKTEAAEKTESAPDAGKRSRRAKKDEKANEKKGVKPYPLDICIVTDNKLGSMGDPMTLVHENQEAKICCKPCERLFRKDPERYLAKLKPEKEEAEKKEDSPEPAPAE